jgi:hypothetical protein
MMDGEGAAQTVIEAMPTYQLRDAIDHVSRITRMCLG